MELGDSLEAVVLAEGEVVAAIAGILDEWDELFGSADFAKQGNEGSALAIEGGNSMWGGIVGHLQQLGGVKSGSTLERPMEVALVQLLFSRRVGQHGGAFVGPS